MLQHILFARLDNVSPTDISRADDRQAHAPATTHTYILAALRVCTRPRPLPLSRSSIQSVPSDLAWLSLSLSLLALLSFSSFLPTVSFFFSRRFSDNGTASKISREERERERERAKKGRKKVATAMSRAQFLAPFSFQAMGLRQGWKIV